MYCLTPNLSHVFQELLSVDLFVLGNIEFVLTMLGLCCSLEVARTSGPYVMLVRERLERPRLTVVRGIRGFVPMRPGADFLERIDNDERRGRIFRAIRFQLVKKALAQRAAFRGKVEGLRSLPPSKQLSQPSLETLF